MADIYCDADDGDDGTGDGSESTPYETLNKGLAESSSGDTVILKAATADYVWVFGDNIDGITLKSDTIPDYLTGTWARINGGGSSNRFDLTGAVTLENLFFYNNSYILQFSCNTAEMLSLDSTRCIFKDLTDFHNGSNNRYGLFGSSAGGSFTNNPTLTFTDCVFWNLESDNSANDRPFNGTWSAITLTNCTFYQDANATFAYKLNGSKTNCILVDEGNTAAVTSSTLDYSCYFGWDVSGATVTNSINSDPLFLDKPNGDFRLRPSSPALDAGTLI